MRMRMMLSGSCVAMAMAAAMVACGDDAVATAPDMPKPDAAPIETQPDAASPIDAPAEATLPPGYRYRPISPDDQPLKSTFKFPC